MPYQKLRNFAHLIRDHLNLGLDRGSHLPNYPFPSHRSAQNKRKERLQHPWHHLQSSLRGGEKKPTRSLAGKPLAGFRATPCRRIPVLYGMTVSVIRFKNPLLHVQPTLRKRRLGENRRSYKRWLPVARWRLVVKLLTIRTSYRQGKGPGQRCRGLSLPALSVVCLIEKDKPVPSPILHVGSPKSVFFCQPGGKRR